MRSILIFLVFLGFACNPKDVRPGPQPGKADCAQMCKHLGPDNLNCEEGEPYYDSDLPGTPGVPNATCTHFCESQMDKGIDLHPECVLTATSCEEVEVERLRCD